MELLELLLLISGIHLLAVASPGPDIALITRVSLTQGRRAGAFCTLGIVSGLVVHLLYSIFGIALLLRETPEIRLALQGCGALYMLWLGSKAIRAQPGGPPADDIPLKGSRYFWSGFIYNLLNVKASFYFLMVFSTLIRPGTPGLHLLAVALVMLGIAGGWFLSVSYLLSTGKVRALIGERAWMIDRLFGVVLIGLGLFLLIEIAGELGWW